MAENKERRLTCIICPRGCELVVTLSADGTPISVTGNSCKRGVGYAEAECTSPMRTVTSTVRCECGSVVAVKTAAPIPKALVFDVMKEINATRVPCNVKIGDVVIENVLDTGVNVVATANARCAE